MIDADAVSQLWDEACGLSWPEIRTLVLARDNYTCQYCGVRRLFGMHVDHVIPRSKGGDNNPRNLVAACWRCNISKGNRTSDEVPDIRHPNRHTPESIKALPTTGKRYRVADSEVAGLSVVVTETGAKRWQVRYYADGRRQTFTIGDAEAITPTSARAKAKKAIRDDEQATRVAKRAEVKREKNADAWWSANNAPLPSEPSA